MIGPDPHLCWGLKESLRSYLQLVPDGAVECRDGAVQTEDGAFEFPPVAGRAAEFRGTVLLTGHGGAMQIELSDPQVEEEAGASFLSVRQGATRLRVAALLRPLLPDESDGSPTTLTADGAHWLGDFYAPGDELDPIALRTPSMQRPAH